MIYEVIVTTLSEDGSAHIAPMGIHIEDEFLIIAPFKPSTTLNNLQRVQHAAINMTDNVQIFAGCLTGHKDWPLTPTTEFQGIRLQQALAHIEVVVDHLEDDELRPRFYCKKLAEFTHASFRGFNRAQAAVLEAAILVSRLDRLPAEKISQEIEYLSIAMEKTAGEEEKIAWDWLMHRIEQHQTGQQNIV